MIYDVQTITLQAGWAEANKFAFRASNHDNMLLIHSRGGNALQVAKERDSADFWTIDANTYLPLSSFNADDVLYFRGTTGDVVELFIQENQA